MVTYLFMMVLGALFALVGSAFPTADPGATPSQATGAIGQVLGMAAGFGVWLPFGTIATCAVIMAGLTLAGFVIRLIRMGVSLFTGGGGGAA